jgi:beta-N-acetylhexosaminidase
MSGPLFLAVDGGGTKTVAVVVDATGNEIGRGHAGPANARVVGFDAALAQVRHAIDVALMVAPFGEQTFLSVPGGGQECPPYVEDAPHTKKGLQQDDLSRPCAVAWLGLAGIDTPHDADALRPHVAALAETVTLTNDAELLLGALDDAIGVALVAGTGSVALGRDQSGRTARASGWGHIIGDEGSGYAIGQGALRAIARAADGRGPVTSLTASILAAWDLSIPDMLIDYVHTQATKTDIARLAPLVLAAWRAGDGVARRIVRQAAREQAQAALAVAKTLTLPDPLSLALGGGVFLHAADFAALALAEVRRTRPGAQAVPVADPALLAAQWLAHHHQKNEVAAMPAPITDRSLADQIGQLFMVGFHATTPTPEILALIREEHVGGIVYFTRNLRDGAQARALAAALQTAAREAGQTMPLLISVDQENGLVRRLGPDATILPGNMALGATDDPALVEAVAAASGRELLAAGVTMNLAPDADVNNNPLNPVIGVRSFGADPARVAKLTAAAVRGYQGAGVVATIKHFPGHGDTATDSHLALPVVPYDRARLDAVELPPFRAGIAAGAECVMLAHVALPQIEPNPTLPASLSPAVVRLLRDDLSYDGVIMTDCLEMQAVAGTVGIPAGAVLALQAGVDLVLISHTYPAQRAAIQAARDALARGDLDPASLRRSLERLARIRSRLPWDAAPLLPEELAAHAALRDAAYARAVTLVRDAAGILPLHLAPEQRLLVVAQHSAALSQAVDLPYDHAGVVAAIQARHPATHALALPASASPTAQADALVAAQEADIIIAILMNAHRDPAQATLVRGLLAIGRPVIAIAAGDPYDATFPDLAATLATYEYSAPALLAAVRVLFGEILAQGTLPVPLA